MAAATAITTKDRPAGHIFGGTCTFDLASIAAAGRELVTVAVPGVAAEDTAVISPRTQLTAGLIISNVRCSAGQIEFAVHNVTGAGVDNASVVADFTVLRGSTMALR